MQDLLKHKNLLATLLIVVVFGIMAYSIYSHYTMEEEKIVKRLKTLKEGEESIEDWKKVIIEEKKARRDFIIDDTLFLKKFIEESARHAGITITSLKPNQLEKDFYWEVKIQLRAMCPYMSFVEFMKLIEEKSLGLDRIRIERKDGQANIDLYLNAIVLK